MAVEKQNITLDPDKIINTIDKLGKRITDRFPDSGLGGVCFEFLSIARQIRKDAEELSRPMIWIRVVGYSTVAIGVFLILFTISKVRFELTNPTFTDIVTLGEAIVNDIVLIGAAIFFLVTLETRVKRGRALKMLDKLRVITHVVDMHQLTKDPALINRPHISTENSPKRTLSRFELQRYLDYCSEILALIGKVAALYSQSLPEEGVVRAVNEIEDLSTS